MIKPKGLTFGDTVGVIAPAGPTTKARVEESYKRLTAMGFKVIMGRSCYAKYGYLAGEDSLRAEDINSMFVNKEIDGILCLRGGYGTLRILDLVDYDSIRQNPKVFVGYSDITGLHIAMSRLANLVTFHGPMLASDMSKGLDEFSRNSLYRFILRDKIATGIINNPAGDNIQLINGGVGEGAIIGGNLSLIVSSLGTPYEIDSKGKLLFIEDIGEEPYRIDRMFNQLRLSGKLDEAEGIILGDFKDCHARGPGKEESLSLDSIIEDVIKPIAKPTIANLRAGHCSPMITLPFGVRARLDSYKGELSILENTIID